MVAGSCDSGFAGGFDQSGRDGFSRRFAAPQYELENGIEALTLFKRRLRNRLGLVERQAVGLPDQRRVAEDDQARARPQFEMAEPKLLVDQAQRFVNRAALFGRDLDVRESEKLEDLVLAAPDAT